MKKGIIAFLIVMAIGVASYFIYMKSLDPKYPGVWDLTSGDDACFYQVEFTSGPKDYKGTILKMHQGNIDRSLLGGHMIEDGKIVVDVFNFDEVGLIRMDHQKKGDTLFLAYDWDGERKQCTYEKVREDE